MVLILFLLGSPKKGIFYCVIYLHPGDYHLVHSPVDWNILKRQHFSGLSIPTELCVNSIAVAAQPLPENAQMPSVSGFAECQTTGTRQRFTLPSARQRALGKDVAHGMPKRYRVPAIGKERHSA